MVAALWALIPILKPFLVPLLTFLAGWLFPSPIKKTATDQAKTHAAEDKADATRGQVDDLDQLP